MLFKFVEVSICRHDGCAELPFVVSSGVLLENGGGNEGFEDEETADIDAVDPVPCPVPRLVERRRPRIGLSVELVGVLRIVHPCATRLSGFSSNSL